MEFINNLAPYKRWIALALLLISFIMLFCNWLTVGGLYKEPIRAGLSYLETSLDDYQNSDYYDDNYGYSNYGMDILDDFIDMDDIDEILEEINDYGLNARKALRNIDGILGAVADGGISVSNTKHILGKGMYIYNAFVKIDKMDGYYDGAPTWAVVATIANVLVTIAYYATILAFIWSAFCQLTKRKQSIWIYGGLYIFWGVLLIGILVFANVVFRDNYISEFVRILPTFWLFLGIASAIGSCLLWKQASREYDSNGLSIEDIKNINWGNAVDVVKDKGEELVSGFKSKAAASWTCPSCGSSQAGKDAFCSQCGTKRPNPVRCANCGNVLSEDSAFCPKCGAKRPVTKNCPRCGTVQDAGAGFCSSCGTALNAPSNTPEQ